MPEFSSKPIKKETKGETKGVKKASPKAKVKKPVAKKAPVKKVVPKKKPVARKPALKKKPAQRKQMEKNLESIYEDDRGKMPDMKKIKVRKNRPFVRGFFSLIIVLGLLAAVAWVGFFTLPNAQKLGKTEVKLAIAGETEVVLGEEVEYTVEYTNDQNTTLGDLSLNVRYPAGFVFTESSLASKNENNNEWDLKDLKPGEKGEVKIKGILYGEVDKEQSWRVFLNYKPGNFKSEMQSVETLTVSVKESPYEISITGPDRASVGNDVEYIFKFENTSELTPEKLELVPNWPENFYVVSSEPELEKNTKWVIEAKEEGEEVSEEEVVNEYKVIGKFTDKDTEETKISVSLVMPLGEDKEYEIAQGEIATEVVKNDLNLNLAINGSLNDFSSQPGDILNTSVNIKNSSEETMKDLVVKLIFDSPSVKKRSVLNWGELNDDNDGDIVGEQLNDITRRGTITWKKIHTKELGTLEPDDEVALDVTLPINTEEVFDLTALEDYKINVLAEANYTDSTGAQKTITANPIVITLNSDLEFESRHSMKNNEYNVNWILSNHLHPLKNVKITADLYGDVTFKSGADKPPAGDLNYDEENKKVTWTIPEMPLDIDVLALPIIVTLQKEDPTQEVLVSKVHISAQDTVTNQELNFMSEEIRLK